MHMATRNGVFEEKLQEYLAGDPKRKGEILNSVCEVTGMHRKAAIRKFRKVQMRDPASEEKRGRSVYYTKDVNAALKSVWEAGGEVCGELLHPQIKELVGILIRDDMWKHSDDATAKLRAMGKITTRRKVSAFMEGKPGRRGISGTKSSHLKEIIPIFAGPWDDVLPGHTQIDTVVHCGPALAGDMAYSVNCTDVATLWSARRAQWNKGDEATRDSLRAIRERFPFSITHMHPDTGSEFINWCLKTWCDEEHIDLARSRPYHKDDNGYVEERNGHIIRRHLGYTRFDCPRVVSVMNDLYEVLDLFLNHFVANKRCIKKDRIGAKYKKVYEKDALTPYARVLAHTKISDAVKEKLKREHSTLNPLVLKKKIDTIKMRITRIQSEFRNRN
jgi:hypothetical protein